MLVCDIICVFVGVYMNTDALYVLLCLVGTCFYMIGFVAYIKFKDSRLLKATGCYFFGILFFIFVGDMFFNSAPFNVVVVVAIMTMFFHLFIIAEET